MNTINRKNIFGYPGPIGESAYKAAVRLGYTGTESQWLASLVGPTGPIGSPMSVWVGSQASYDALGAWDNSTLYFVV